MRSVLIATALGALAALTFSVSPASAQDDVAAASEAICCGAACCFIDSVCRARGEVNPDNACQMCDTANQGAWTDIAGCGDDAGPGGGTDAGPGTDDGGGCRVSPGAPGAPLGLGLAFVAAAMLTIRRRRP